MNSKYKILVSNSSFEILKINNLYHNFPMHIHKRVCIGRIDSGTKFLFINGKNIQLVQGDIFIIPAYKPHMCYVNAGSTVSYTVICADDINRLYEGIISGHIILNKIIKRTILDLLFSHYFASNISQYSIKNQKVKNVLNYIDENYMEEMTIDILAKRSCLSPYHLLHLFKEELDISLHQYIIQTRVKKFREKATSTRKNILDIGLSCGFYDQSHLIRNFKKHIGTTPQKYINSIEVI